MHHVCVLRTPDSQKPSAFARGICMALGAIWRRAKLTVQFKERLATILGFLGAAIVPSVATAIADSHGRSGAAGLVTLTAIYYPFSIVFSFWLAVPMYFVLKQRQLIRWWSASATGLLIGSSIGLFLYWPRMSFILFYVGVGALSGLVFWFFWRLGHNTAQQAAPEDAFKATRL
jgi:hypothetical protein